MPGSGFDTDRRLKIRKTPMRKAPDTGSNLAARAIPALVAATLAATSLLLVPVNASAATTSDRSGHRPERYLLALGDSISFGFQGPKLTNPPNPAAFDTGYVDILAARQPPLAVTTTAALAKPRRPSSPAGARGAKPALRCTTPTEAAGSTRPRPS